MPPAVHVSRHYLAAVGPDPAAGRLAAGAALAFVSLGVVIARADDGWLGRVDQRFTNLAAHRRSQGLIAAARAISALAEPHVALMPIAASAAAAARQGSWSAGLAACLTVTTGASVRRVLSRAVARPRPPAAYWRTEPEGFSLPSKHTCLAALTAGACASALGSGPAGSQAAALAAAAAVGTSRVCLGVHWPTDVLAAWLFAAGWLNLARLAGPRPICCGSR